MVRSFRRFHADELEAVGGGEEGREPRREMIARPASFPAGTRTVSLLRVQAQKHIA